MEANNLQPVVPFQFRECVVIPKATGVKAATVHELEDRIAAVSDESLYHHTYQYVLKGHLQEYTNEFAEWAGESIEERALAEKFTNLDPYELPSIEALREALIRIIREYLETNPEPRPVAKGNEFYFNETLTMIFNTSLRARNLAEFLIALQYLEPGSLYFHFYEARNRSTERTNDFSNWVRCTLEKEDLATEIDRIDPFMFGLEGLRNQIVSLVDAELRKDMEGLA